MDQLEDAFGRTWFQFIINCDIPATGLVQDLPGKSSGNLQKTLVFSIKKNLYFS